MGRIHKAGAESGYLTVLAVLLFLTVCAYTGAGLYGKLGRDLMTVEAEVSTVTDSIELNGTALRRERIVRSQLGAELTVQDGCRVPLGGELAVLKDGSTLDSPCSAVFFEKTDGYEDLSVDSIESLSPSSVRSLLNEKPLRSTRILGRLVCDFEWYFAAVCSAEALPLEGRQCRIQFEGMDKTVPARIISISPPERGEAALLLRLCCGGLEYMQLRKSSAQLIYSEYTGIEVPEQSVHTDSDGTEFVYTLTAGVIEKKAVEIIYTDGDICLTRKENRWDSLREGNTVIVSGQNLYEGRIVEA